MDHRVYLQGSYANSTNIRGDSDVDVVVETRNVFYHNVPLRQRQLYGLTESGSYTWMQFRTEVRLALLNYYGANKVADGNKSIKVYGNAHRLNADVVPCSAYRQYQNHHYTQGITFWTGNGVQIVNFPGHHRNNGARKNDACHMRYKPNVRVLKNARNSTGSAFPSYFLECLMYNAPDHCFETRFESTFCNVVNHLSTACSDGTLVLVFV